MIVRIVCALVAAVAAALVVDSTARLQTLGSVGQRMQASDPAIRRALFDELQPVALANCRLQRFGEPHDGGYLLCGNLLDGVAAGYSYGISGYDQWGCDVATRLRVRVHQYDCFNTNQPACPGGDTMFHAECVGDAARQEDGRLFDTMQHQFGSNGDAGKRVVVKMDVEGAEWDSLLHAADETLQRIDQLVIELHFVDDKKFVTVVQRLKRFFHVAHVHFNNFSCTPGIEPFPAWAYEVLFVNKRLGVADPAAPPPSAMELTAPNAAGLPDCQAVRPIG